MSILTRHPWVRWGGPVAALGVVAALSVAGSIGASADPTLPPRTPAELVADLAQARVSGLSGTVVQSADFGLPQLGLPAKSGGGSADLGSIATGTHTWKVWYGGQDKQRVALLGSGGESDLVHNGPDLWVWSSADRSATHYTVPAKAALPTSVSDLATDLSGAVATAIPRSPQELAERFLAFVDPSTEVASGGTATVAGRAAYQLVFTPRDRESLVASVRLAVDAETKVPLRVQVMSRQLTTPAIEVGFTSVDFATPEARMFSFDPPPDTRVTEGGTPGMHSPAESAPTAPATPSPTTGAGIAPRIVGSGWGAVAVGTLGSLPLPGLPSSTAGSTPTPTGGSGSGDLATRLLASLPRVSGSWGSGRVFAGTLFTVVLADDGRVAVGAVGVDRVTAALAAR